MMDVRPCPGVPVRRPCGFSSVQLAGEGAVINLSSKGCAVKSHAAVQTGTCLEVWIVTPDRSFAAIVDVAFVVWSGEDRFGMKFLYNRPEEESRISEMVQRFPHSPEGTETRRYEPASLFLVARPEDVRILFRRIPAPSHTCPRRVFLGSRHARQLARVAESERGRRRPHPPSTPPLAPGPPRLSHCPR